MKTNDQYFEPGDKVMRVGKTLPSETGWEGPHDYKSPPYGEVLCVEDFHEDPRCNVVIFVGYGGWRRSKHDHWVGWAAKHFRKVEEIQTCLRAVNHVVQNQPIQIPVP